MSHRITKKVLLVGWDGADWQHITPLLDAGKLPGLESIINHGVMANLATLQPVLSPMLWNSIATGKTADKHGVLGFAEPRPDGKGIRPTTSHSRQVKAIWNILHSQEMRCNVVGWWASHPAEPINGNVVTNVFNAIKRDRQGELTIAPGTIHPVEREQELGQLKVGIEEIVADDILPFVPQAANIDQKQDRRFYSLLKIISDCASIQAVTTRLLEVDDWDLTAVYFDAIDHFCHAFMPFHPPQMPGVSEPDFEMYQSVVQGAYQFHDMMLQRLMELAGPEATIVLCSDHGFQSGHLRPVATPMEPAGPAMWHRQHGILVVAGPGIKRDERIYGANIIDITPTLLHMFGLPVGQDMDGRVLLEAFEYASAVESVTSWENEPGEFGMHDSESVEANGQSNGTPPSGDGAGEVSSPTPRANVDQELINQFVALGYINDPSQNREQAVADCRLELDYNLARVYLSSNRAHLALPLFTNLVEQSPWEDRFWKNLARCCFECRMYQTTIEILNQLYRKPGQRPLYSTILLARSYLGLGERELANQTLRPVLDGEPRFPMLLATLGESYLNQNDVEMAETFFRKALASDAELAMGHQGLSSVYLKRRNFAAAAESAFDSIACLYRMPRAHLNLGFALMLMGNHDRAESALKTVLNFPNTRYQALAHRLLARLYRMQGESETSAKHRKLAAAAMRDQRTVTRDNTDFNLSDLPPIPDFEKRKAIHLDKRKPRMPDEQREPSGQEFVIVSGLPRSGTSLMMQLLDAAGWPAKTDGIRTADEDNPMGYFEWEKIKELPTNPNLLDEPGLGDHAIKVISLLLPFLPKHHSYKVIFMMRSIEQVVASQDKMLRRKSDSENDGDHDASIDELVTKLTTHRHQILNFLQNAPQIQLLVVQFESLVEDPLATWNRLGEFVKFKNSISDQEVHGLIKRDLVRNRD